MILGEVFRKEGICVCLESGDKEEVLEELVELYLQINPDANRIKILQTVKEREVKMTTGIVQGVAVPHGRCSIISEVKGVIGISREGIDFEALDNMPVHLFFFIVAPVDDCGLHLRILKRLALLIKNPTFVNDILQQKDASSVYHVLCQYEDELSSL